MGLMPHHVILKYEMKSDTLVLVWSDDSLVIDIEIPAGHICLANDEGYVRKIYVRNLFAFCIVSGKVSRLLTMQQVSLYHTVLVKKGSLSQKKLNIRKKSQTSLLIVTVPLGLGCSWSSESSHDITQNANRQRPQMRRLGMF